MADICGPITCDNSDLDDMVIVEDRLLFRFQNGITIDLNEQETERCIEKLAGLNDGKIRQFLDSFHSVTIRQ